MRPLSVYVHTVGCAKNLVDSEILLGQMGGAVRVVEEGAAADLIVVNTCGFIDAAKSESIDAVMEAVRLKEGRPGRRVAVMGCLSERYRDQIRAEIPELDGVYGVGEFGALLRDAGLRPALPEAGPDDLGLFTRRVLLSPAHSAYLRVSDGCDQHCTYCSIPLMRGRMRSRPVAELRREAEALAARGVQELNLIGQELSSYGRDLGDGAGIGGLLRALDDCGVAWIRVLYTHPPLVDEAFADAMAACPRVLPYLDFPVEHVSGHVLRRMGRRGDGETIARQMAMLRGRLPGLVLRSSLISGFPGEREQDFRELADFLRAHPFDRLGVFLWSPEEGTPSVHYDGQVPREVAEARRDLIMEEQMARSLAANQALVGSRDLVLVDEVDEAAGTSLARGYRDALDIDNGVEVEGRHAPGRFLEVEYTDALEYDLFARPAAGPGRDD